jgi:type IV pilus assembly protein PilC
VRDRLAAGDSFSESLSACGDYFPSLVRDLAEVGEKTGRVDETLLGLADHYDHLLTLRRTFLMGIAWPALQLLMALGVIGLLIWVMGILGTGLDGQPIDILGLGLVGTPGLVIYVLLLAVVFGGGTVLVMAVLRGAFGAAPLRLAMQIPVIGGCLRTSALSRFAWTLSLTLDSGLDARRAMELALRSTQNSFFTSQIAEVDAAIGAGREFHESLRQTRLFPDEFLDALETAEVSGTQGESLARLANDYRDRAQNAARLLTVAASVAVWIAVAAFLVLMIFRLAMFYIGTLQNALNGI